MRLRHVLVTGLCALGFCASASVAVIYAWANGLCAGTLALASVPALCILLAVALRRPKTWRLVALLVAVDLTWCVARIARPASTGLHACVNLTCDDRGAFWQRVPDEHEAARAGLYLSSAVGAVDAADRVSLGDLLDREYGAFPLGWRGLPNALLLQSTPDHVESLRWVPPNAANAPCLVFLHGYGGALTAYLRPMIDGEIGRRFVIVAPALDRGGAWWTREGRAVVERVVTQQLPPEVDRSRVYLIGLSNGATGASRVMQDPQLRPLFAGFVLVSGGQPIESYATQLYHAPVLMFAGRRDDRFPFVWLGHVADEYRAAGAQVELVDYDADHYLMLTHADAWMAKLLAWTAR